MKFYAVLSFAISSLFLTACSNNGSAFRANDLNPEIYQGYWAMLPVEHQYRVVRFNQNGSAKIYDYTCNHQDGSYSLNETETVYFRTLGKNRFTLLDANKKPFAKYEILQLNKQRLQARQSFDKEKPLILNYTHLKGAKPLCY